MSGNRVYSLDLPDVATCLVADSPHSGRDYPADFRYACPLPELRKSEDAWLDQLYDFLPGLGVAFLQASFPRAYIDANRPDDVTAAFSADPGGLYRHHDNSLVRDVCAPHAPYPIYGEPLTLREVFSRFNNCWRPYHAALENMVEGAAARHGQAVHLDLHSMPSYITSMRSFNTCDVIIGTLGDTTAAPALTHTLADLFRARGYVTACNAGLFRGREIIARTGFPVAGRHSIQIEINRALYLNEETLEMAPRAASTKEALKGVMRDFAGFCAKF